MWAPKNVLLVLILKIVICKYDHVESKDTIEFNEHFLTSYIVFSLFC